MNLILDHSAVKIAIVNFWHYRNLNAIHNFSTDNVIHTQGAFTPDANKSNKCEVGRLKFTRFIRTRNSCHSRVKFTTQQTRIRVMGGASARQLQSRCKMYSCFCKSTKMYIQLRVPTYNHNYFVLHCCFGFSASARNDVTARASSWLVNAARISAKVQIFQLVRITRKNRSIRVIRATSFARIALQDCLSRLCIDSTCKSFARFASFASGVNAPLQPKI